MGTVSLVAVGNSLTGFPLHPDETLKEGLLRLLFLMHWDNFSDEFVHLESNMSLSSVTLGAGNEFPGVALVTGAAGSGILSLVPPPSPNSG
jgi:hypothetical protein